MHDGEQEMGAGQGGAGRGGRGRAVFLFTVQSKNTKASFSRRGPVGVTAKQRDGERLCSANCSPLSTGGEISSTNEKREQREAVSYRLHEDTETVRPGSSPRSSSSEVIDLERIDSAVVGARLGGGGANKDKDAHLVKTLSNRIIIMVHFSAVFCLLLSVYSTLIGCQEDKHLLAC